MKKFLIIDGNAIVHRAFHAFPPLHKSDGRQVNAVYGFFSILIKALEEVKPEYLAICFDRPKPTFRKLMYAGYQAHRPKMADGLGEQIVLLHEALEKIGIPVFEIDGYEADDVIGTLAAKAIQLSVLGFQLSDTGSSVVSNSVTDKQKTGKLATENGKQKTDNRRLEIIILSGDRDLLQLVNSHVKILAPVVGITKFILYDEATVAEKFGIKPSQIIDYKALVGDASDGYPGVSGIGPKTASGLLKQYGSFENLYQRLADLPEKIALKLATDAEQAALAKKLATISLDAPVQLDIEICNMRLFTKEKVAAVCEEFGFQSLKKRLGVFAGTEPEIKENIKKKREQLQLI